MSKHIETILNHDKSENNDSYGAVVPPIYQNSLFTFKNWDAINDAFDDKLNSFIYSRGKNPTVKIVEEKLAAISGAEKAQLFPSGMAAITAAFLHFLDFGDHVISIKNMYGPANNLISDYLTKKMKIEISYVTGNSVDDFKNAIQNNTKLIYLESPSSAIFSLQDIPAITALAKANNIKTIIDNTWATPYFQNTIDMGIDIEIQSSTKYLGGHSDLLGGVLCGKQIDIDSISKNEYELLGSKVAPMEAWLLLRSLRTLPIRLKQHQENALLVANFLEENDKIEVVNYPGLPSFPQYNLGKKLMKGYSGLMSFKLKTNNLNEIKSFINALTKFKIGVSWGGHESLVYAPAISYLKELKPSQFKNLGISLGDIRISVGLEHVEDLIEDLKQALEHI
ncbi:trans-sulfuration enzyme family protein [Thalassobellus citreus]|uniref:trans-sulfuration enzyme family protein n=1 Tax=Thalassobellus citreus TaxID=3367752 RepID=UPI003789D982